MTNLELTAVAGAYFRGDEKQKQLQRIYGTAFPSKKDMDEHFARIEEARSRRAPQPVHKPMDDGDASHLPAFLLRPVTVKA